ncbi:MAG: hypothetical protein EOM37_04825 [Proteobacteria bacterium]|jgi:hypothetical protein|nr:hypothetical protein [Alphaproteobacteria bacterium]NCC03356.1 hypothetical protein [Pseudomonadota bacterium]
MIDTYLRAVSCDELLGLRAFLRNVMEPVKGREAVDETIDEEGNIVPAQDAAGDPAFYYSCVRASFPVPAFGGLNLVDEETGQAVCGVWAD